MNNNNYEMKSNVFSDYGNTNNLNNTPNTVSPSVQNGQSNTPNVSMTNNQNVQSSVVNQNNFIPNTAMNIPNQQLNNTNQNMMENNVNNMPTNDMGTPNNMVQGVNQVSNNGTTPNNQITNGTTTSSIIGVTANNGVQQNTQGAYFNQVPNNQVLNNGNINGNPVVQNPNQIPFNQDIAMPKLNNDETVGTVKKDTQKSPVAMLILFACLIIGLFLTPYITPYFSDILKIFGIEDNSSIYGNGKDDSTSSNTTKDNNISDDNANNDSKATTYYDILEATAITFEKLTISNLTKTEENGLYYLNYKITNNDTSSYNFRDHKIYFDLYNDAKTYIGRVLIDTDSLSSKEEITLKSILNENEYTAATKLEVLERTTADYQSISLKNNKLTCNGNNHSTIYTFTSNKLTGIDDTYNYTFVVNDDAYVQYALNVQNTVNDLNKITGVSAGFVNTQTGFTKTMKINYSETSENLTKYDRIYYEKDATASTVKYELESIGYKCD